MAKCRCAIWTSGAGVVGACVVELLQRLADVDLVPLSGKFPLSAPADVDALMFVAQSSSLAATLALVAEVRSRFPGCALLAAGDHLNASELTALVAGGIYDFLSIPFSEDELAARLRRAVGKVQSYGERALQAPGDRCLRDFLGKSPAFVKQVARIRLIARCDAGVLILGETGTGKEACAQAIHYLSARASRPCVALNCGAIPLDLVESELFGHVKGAYTTAHASKPGLVHEAEGGSLFLDDIDCLPVAAQAKLLRFLQEREYRSVGATTVYRSDVRVIAASNRQLSQLVARGEFRQDLYYRLNVLTVDLPPLRERRDDIPDLARHFVGKFAMQYQRPVAHLSPQALDRLCAHDWPGNVRELQNALERAVLLTPHPVIAAEDLELPPCDEAGQTPESFRAAKERLVANFERSFVEQLLATHGGNVTHAASAARKNRRAFFQLMRKHHIESASFRSLQS
jgi:two-component system, NtrC family, response regulator GlrR